LKPALRVSGDKVVKALKSVPKELLTIVRCLRKRIIRSTAYK
jgi:hypothetical protein